MAPEEILAKCVRDSNPWINTGRECEGEWSLEKYWQSVLGGVVPGEILAESVRESGPWRNTGRVCEGEWSLEKYWQRV